MPRHTTSPFHGLSLALPLLALLAAPRPAAADCRTRYPILLVHGVSLQDHTLGFDYFGRIGDHLRACGAVVVGGGQDAWSTGSDNAAQLEQRIYEVMAVYGVDRVNVIAHSKGGVDVRYLFHRFPWMRGHVASFTTLASPHRGSVLADLILGALPGWAEPYVGDVIDVIGLLQGDASPDALGAGYQLTRSGMAAANALLGDLAGGVPGVYTQSWCAQIKGVVLDTTLQTTGVAMALGGESPNDGAVWTRSCPYAVFRGTASGAWWSGGVTHFGIVDRGVLLLPGLTPGFDALGFFDDLVAELRDRGF